jgi:hypothetical protein
MNIIINQMDRLSVDGFVTVVHWTVTKTSGEFTASQYGTESFEPDAAAPGFKPYEQLTQADVTGWLTDRWGTDGVAAKEAALDAQLAALANPPVISGTPWGQA